MANTVRQIIREALTYHKEHMSTVEEFAEDILGAFPADSIAVRKEDLDSLLQHANYNLYMLIKKRYLEEI